MTNAEKFLKDGVDLEEFIGEFNDFISKQIESQSACVRLAQFLKYPSKPTLSEDEKVILRNISKAYENIKRDDDGFLTVENEHFSASLSMFNYDLFKFIKPRRRI